MEPSLKREVHALLECSLVDGKSWQWAPKDGLNEADLSKAMELLATAKLALKEHLNAQLAEATLFAPPLVDHVDEEDDGSPAAVGALVTTTNALTLADRPRSDAGATAAASREPEPAPAAHALDWAHWQSNAAFGWASHRDCKCTFCMFGPVFSVAKSFDPPKLKQDGRRFVSVLDSFDAAGKSSHQRPPTSPPAKRAQRDGRGGGRMRRLSSTSTMMLDDGALTQMDPESMLLGVSLAIFQHIDTSGARVPEDLRCSHFRVFDDDVPGEDLPNEYWGLMPSVSDVFDLIAYIHGSAQMETECTVVAVIYMERFLRNWHPQLTVCSRNWRTLLLVCLLVASKFYDDCSIVNGDFGLVCQSFLSLQRINDLEVALLAGLQYDCIITQTEYAKYYFACRDLLAKHRSRRKSSP